MSNFGFSAEDWEFDFASNSTSASKPQKEVPVEKSVQVKAQIRIWYCYICAKELHPQEGAPTSLNEREELLIHHECKKFNIDDNKY